MNVFIRQQNNAYQWFQTSDASADDEGVLGSIEELAAFYQQHAAIKHWVFIVPAIDVASRTIEFTEKEKKHIQKAVPFLLEESLLTEADDLHVVMNNAADKSHVMDVVAIDEALLTRYLDAFTEAGIRITHCVSESLFLPESDAQWQIFYRNKEFIIHAETRERVAIDAEHLALSLELLSDGYSNMPASIELITATDAEYKDAIALMPLAVSPLIRHRKIGYASMLQQQFAHVAKLWNLLTGPFAVSKEWLSMVKPWRWVAVSLAAVFILNTVLTMTQLSQQKQRSVELRREMDATIRQVIPRGSIVDHRRQLERYLTSATAGNSGEPFILQMDKVGQVLNKHAVQTLNSLNYDVSKSELRLDLLVKDYDVLQNIMAGIKAAGMEAEIQNSNAQGDQLRARLRITG